MRRLENFVKACGKARKFKNLVLLPMAVIKKSLPTPPPEVTSHMRVREMRVSWPSYGRKKKLMASSPLLRAASKK
jgi:hypothetical protein